MDFLSYRGKVFDMVDQFFHKWFSLINQGLVVTVWGADLDHAQRRLEQKLPEHEGNKDREELSNMEAAATKRR